MAATTKVMLAWMKLGRNEEVAEQYEVGHLPGEMEDRHHRCRMNRLLMLRTPNALMAENGRQDEEVLV